MLQKRGQVTIFIVVGIVMLLAFATITYFSKTFIEEKISAEGDPIIADAPREFIPIQRFTENCISRVAKKGLIALGQHGGYINPSILGEFNPDDPTDGVGLASGSTNIAYWHFNVKPNEAKEISFATLRPEMSGKNELSIQAQLERHLEENLNECLNNYESFKSQGYQIESENPSLSVKITNNTVNFWNKMRVYSTLDERENTMDQFFVKIPLRLQHYYDVATEIAIFERGSMFLEGNALDLLSTYGRMDRQAIPPRDGLSFDRFAPAQWSTQEIEGRVKNMLSTNVPVLRYLGSDNFYRYDYTTESITDYSYLYQKTYDNTIVPLETADRLNVAFDYHNYPLYFDVNDADGIVKPRSISVKSPVSFIPFDLNFHHYVVKYDLSYPVLVTIEDPIGLDGKPYVFSFALEVNVRNSAYPFEGEQYSDVKLPPASPICNEVHRNSEVLNSLVVDAASDRPLAAVELSLVIPNEKSCDLGQTDNRGSFSGSYPKVIGGVGSYVKEGYLTNFYPLNTYEPSSNIVGYAIAGQPKIEMYPFRTISVSGAKANIEKCGKSCFVRSSGNFVHLKKQKSYYEEDESYSWKFNPSLYPLVENEKLVFILEKLEDLREPFVFSEEHTVSGEITHNTSAEIKLVPGRYKLTSFLSRDESYVVPKREYCTSGVLESIACFDLDGCCNTVDKIEEDQLFVGANTWDSSDYYFEVTPEDLYSSSELILPTLNLNLYGLPLEHRRPDDLGMLGDLGNYSQQLRNPLEPIWQ